MSKSKAHKEHPREPEVETFDQEMPKQADIGNDTDQDQPELKNMEQDLQDKEKEIASMKQELSEAHDQLLRKAAEFENMKKRTERERVQIFELSRAEALKEFLPINDDLKRTLDAADINNVDDKFLDGVKLVASKFDEVLSKYGVERIDEVNVPFNVDLHDAMLKQKAETEVEPNTVLAILEPGYKMNDRVIRHAKVIVSE